MKNWTLCSLCLGIFNFIFCCLKLWALCYLQLVCLYTNIYFIIHWFKAWFQAAHQNFLKFGVLLDWIRTTLLFIHIFFLIFFMNLFSHLRSFKKKNFIWTNTRFQSLYFSNDFFSQSKVYHCFVLMKFMLSLQLINYYVSTISKN